MIILRAFARSVRLLLPILVMVAAVPAMAAAPELVLSLSGKPRIVFNPKTDACDGHDVPDAPARAYRDAKGHVVLFAMHFENRALRGPDFDNLKLDCRVVFRGSGNADPAAYDDRSWIASTWTVDGTTVSALIHHEYQGNQHKGRCSFEEYIKCWTNSVLAVTSSDAGVTFAKPKGSPIVASSHVVASPQVVASWPFRQDVGQGRHRGFFNPSNIFSDGTHAYVFAATTGWTGQDHGACLFRNVDPRDPAGWRAWDGEGFRVRFGDPYREKPDPLKTCKPIAPFPAPVGSITRHRDSGLWIGVFQAAANAGSLPVSGIYYATARNLTQWSEPRLLMAGATLYDDACKSRGRLINYPSLIDAKAKGRNFDDVGNSAGLYIGTIRVEGCNPTSDRTLERHPVSITRP
jgi:hypothetical protein